MRGKKAMAVLPYFGRELFDIFIWLIVVFFVMSRASGVDFEVRGVLDDAKIDTLSQMLLNSPNCLAYEKFQIEFADSSSSLLSMAYPGLIDITKFFDGWHQNCLRYAEVWRLILPDPASTLRLCGHVVNTFFGITTADYNIDCPNDRKGNPQSCIQHRCISSCSDGVCGSGSFLTYEVELKDLEAGKDYSFVSYETLAQVQFQPALVGAGGEWAGQNYPEQISCKTDFTQSVYKITQPVFIAYPKNTGLNEDPQKHAGIINITICRGTYGQSTNAGSTLPGLIYNLGR